MSAAVRYAVYFVPARHGALYRFGATTLGYDCYTGDEVPSWPALASIPMDWIELTREPRSYGFHATLKAPFRLREDCNEADLVAEFRRFLAAPRDIPTITPSIEVLEEFIAIVPQRRNPDLEALAAAGVRTFDHFRAPMTAQERARRLHSKLSDHQLENIERWGYPYVFEDFRFHMTLTGRIPHGQQAAIRSFLQQQFSASDNEHPIPIDGIALLRQQDRNARFRVICHALEAECVSKS